jgi:hypothetical protein
MPETYEKMKFIYQREFEITSHNMTASLMGTLTLSFKVAVDENDNCI